MILLSKCLQTSNLKKKKVYKKVSVSVRSKNIETRFLQKCIVTLHIIIHFLLWYFSSSLLRFLPSLFRPFSFLTPPPFNIPFSSFLISIPPLRVCVPATTCLSEPSAQNGCQTSVLARLLLRDRQPLFDRKRSQLL